MAAAVRRARPQMHRGGWEWDRLLSRYVDGGRDEAGALCILRAYFLSILDRYDEAVQRGEGDTFNLFPGHGAWGSGGRMRIYEELSTQGLLTPHERAKYEKIVSQSLGLGFDYPARFAERVNAVTADDVLRVARAHLRPDHLTIVTVGPD